MVRDWKYISYYLYNDTGTDTYLVIIYIMTLKHTRIFPYSNVVHCKRLRGLLSTNGHDEQWPSCYGRWPRVGTTLGQLVAFPSCFQYCCTYKYISVLLKNMTVLNLLCVWSYVVVFISGKLFIHDRPLFYCEFTVYYDGQTLTYHCEDQPQTLNSDIHYNWF